MKSNRLLLQDTEKKLRLPTNERNAMITRLKYGNTNTFLIRGTDGYLLVDTDYAGLLRPFYQEIKKCRVAVRDIRYILATHFHPDHMGLIGELTRQGPRLLLMDTQADFIHFADPIFFRDGLTQYAPIRGEEAVLLPCRESRAFLHSLGIEGEILSTPSHSPDSVSLILDSGDCFVGDLEPYEYLKAYTDNAALRSDWAHILSFHPKRIFYAHIPEKRLS